MPNRYLSEHRLALACSIALHAGLAAWIAWPSAQTILPPQQQVVDISVVMLSSLAPEQAEAAPTATPEHIQPVAPEKQVVLQKHVSRPKTAFKKTESKHEQSVASTPLTTGPQSPNATQKVAAITKPVFDAVSLHNPPPAYPESARNRGIEGNVMLEVDVTEQGIARDVTIIHSSGYALLDKVAHDTIRQWRFVPARRGDEIVEAKVNVPIEFKLE